MNVILMVPFVYIIGYVFSNKYCVCNDVKLDLRLEEGYWLTFFYFRWYSIEILFSVLLWYSIEILFFVIFYLCTLILLFLFDNIHYFLWMYFFLFVLGYGCLVSLSYLHVEVFIGLTCCIIFKLYYVVLLFVNHVCIYFMICVINGWIL